MYCIHYEFTLSQHVPGLAQYLESEREHLYPKLAYIALAPVQCQYNFHKHTLVVQYPLILTENERELLREIIHTIAKHFMVSVVSEHVHSQQGDHVECDCLPTNELNTSHTCQCES